MRIFRTLHVLVLPLTIWATTIFGQSLESNDAKPIHQLRIYEVPIENKQAFHNRFRSYTENYEKLWIQNHSYVGVRV